tara:strand:- start:1929 stop:3188 length:1260 start_codon:yes stop_codon:yes gene_type:complete
MFFWYKLLSYLFYPVSKIYLFSRKLKSKEHKTRYKEKFSEIKIERSKGFLVWFHAASVGESLSILPIIENLEKNEKIKKILITTITVSSAEVLEKRIISYKKVVHQFLPLDIPILVKKFLDHWLPDLAVFVDSEIWPNTISAISKKKIPLVLVNARITKKTYKKWKILKNFSKNIFEKFNLCIVSNNETEIYLKDLGVKNIKNYGNLKFTTTEKNLNNKLDNNYLINFKNRKIWCAASTHPTEEIFCAKTHLLLKTKYNNILTIIIPRHINRIAEIKKELEKLNLKISLYSKANEFNSTTDILLIDAYGEGSKFFNISKYVFLGGSLIKHGGQNPIESSRLGCKIFHGPNISNFLEIYEYLKSLNVSKEIKSEEELSQSLVEEFKLNNADNIKFVEKIDKYGQNILNSVISDLKKYINI